MIGSIGAPSFAYVARAHHAQAGAAAADPSSADPAAGDASATEAGRDGPASAVATSSDLLSSSTLSNLLGLQMIDGHVQGGASGAALGLPQISTPAGMNPNALLNGPTLQALQSIGA